MHTIYFYLLSYSSKRGKGGTKRLGLHKGASQKLFIYLFFIYKFIYYHYNSYNYGYTEET